MRNSGTKSRVKDWIRLAAKFGLVLTDPKLRAAVGDGIKDRVDDMTDRVASKYEDMTDTVANKYQDATGRLEAATAALQGKRHWSSRLTGFLLGVGVGAGLGILLAPASGAETRNAVRSKAADMKDQVYDSAATATERLRQSVTRMPSAGTAG
jgi:gas vesicle protein